MATPKTTKKKVTISKEDTIENERFIDFDLLLL